MSKLNIPIPPSHFADPRAAVSVLECELVLDHFLNQAQ